MFFVAADGSLFWLCPVAPFGSAVPMSVLGSLKSSVDGTCIETSAWLQQARPGYMCAGIVNAVAMHLCKMPLQGHCLGCWRGTQQEMAADLRLMQVSSSGDWIFKRHW